jgi:alanine dehydrogenase
VSGIPVLRGRDVRRAVSPDRAVEAVRGAFVAHARGEWQMPSKVYVTNYPAGDFRAMPAIGAGRALLKWVTSFPGNPARGLPTVSGLVLVSDADDGSLLALLDAGAVTALRTGAAAVLAAETLGRASAGSASVVGAGVNGRAAAETFLARGRQVALWDVDPERARAAATELGAEVAESLEAALAADLVVTVTPGHQVLLAEGTLSAGQHVSLMGADGPGKAEAAAGELARAHLFCDDWDQASHGGELAHAVDAGVVGRDDVTAIGDVLTGAARGRIDDAEITAFDSTGLAIQDLAIAIAALEQLDELDVQFVQL